MFLNMSHIIYPNLVVLPRRTRCVKVFSLSPVLFSHAIISLPFFQFLLFTFLGIAQLPSWKILRGENQLLHHLRAKGILFSPGLSWDTENSSLISHYLYASLRRGVRFWSHIPDYWRVECEEKELSWFNTVKLHALYRQIATEESHEQGHIKGSQERDLFLNISL